MKHNTNNIGENKMELNDGIKFSVPNSEYKFGLLAGRTLIGRISKINKKSYEVTFKREMLLNNKYQNVYVCLLVDRKEYSIKEIAKGR